MYEYNIKNIRVIDGDTIEGIVDLGFNISRKEIFRLRGIDTPEIKGEQRVFGLTSKQYTQEFLSKQEQYRIKSYSKDKYGRYLAEIFNDKDECLNDLLLENGLAEILMLDFDIQEYDKCNEDMVYFVEKYLDVKLRDWQKEYISKKNIQVLQERRIGFSFLIALRIVHSIIFQQDRTIVYMSTTAMRHLQRDTILELIKKCTFQYKPKVIESLVSLTRFDNGMKIVYIGSTCNTRGFAISELYLDGFSEMSSPNQEEIANILIPCLARHDKTGNIWVSDFATGNRYIFKNLEQYILTGLVE